MGFQDYMTHLGHAKDLHAFQVQLQTLEYFSYFHEIPATSVGWEDWSKNMEQPTLPILLQGHLLLFDIGILHFARLIVCLAFSRWKSTKDKVDQQHIKAHESY